MDFIGTGGLRIATALPLTIRAFSIMTLLLGVFSLSSQAAIMPPPPPPATITLEWDPSPSASVINYNVYVGTNSQSYTRVINAGTSTTCVITNLTRGVWHYFAVTSVGAYGQESEFSAELIFLPPIRPQMALSRNTGGPAVISALAIQGYTYSVLASEDLKSWTTLGTVTANSVGQVSFSDPAAGNFKKRFYRLRQISP